MFAVHLAPGYQARRQALEHFRIFGNLRRKRVMGQRL